MSKKKLFRFIRIATTSALLLFVLHKAGLFDYQGWQELLNILIHAKLGFILASLGISFLMTLSSAIKWLMLSRSLGLSVNLRRLLAYYIVGKFFNLVLPSNVGGDVIRMQKLGQYTGRYADATASVFVERFSGLATLVYLALIAVIIKLHILNLAWLNLSLGLGILGTIIIYCLIIDERPFNFVQNYLVKHFPLLQSFFTKIGKFRQAVLFYKQVPYAIHWALINSFIFYFLAITNIWVILLAFRADISFTITLVAVPIIMFIMNIPISIGGIGLMEFAFSFILGLMGVKPTLAISAALFIRTQTLIDAGIGGVLYSFFDAQKS